MVTRARQLLLCALLCSVGSVSAADLNIPSGRYAVAKEHAYLTFSYLHQGLSRPLLRATAIDGELALDANALENSQALIAVEADSIRTNTSYFDQELASPKFFNAAAYPHITFASQRYEVLTERTGKLHGVITVRGIRRPLVLDVTINGAIRNPINKKPVIGVSAHGELRRSEFELDRFIPAVSDEVSIAIEIEFEQGSNTSSSAAALLAAATLGDVDAR